MSFTETRKKQVGLLSKEHILAANISSVVGSAKILLDWVKLTFILFCVFQLGSRMLTTFGHNHPEPHCYNKQVYKICNNNQNVEHRGKLACKHLSRWFAFSENYHQASINDICASTQVKVLARELLASNRSISDFLINLYTC